MVKQRIIMNALQVHLHCKLGKDRQIEVKIRVRNVRVGGRNALILWIGMKLISMIPNQEILVTLYNKNSKTLIKYWINYIMKIPKKNSK